MAEHIDLTGRASNRCPFCGRPLTSDPSENFGDTTCPGCRQPLFFIRVGRETAYYGGARAGRMRERLISVIAMQLGVDKAKVTPKVSFIDDLGADSLDLVELVMVIEEEDDAQ